MTHGFFLSMGGFIVTQVTPTKNVYYPVTPKLLENLVVDPVSITSIPAADLMDRSSCDSLFLFLAFLQSVWFISQIVGRWISGMEVTQLEVVTLAILGMSSLIFGMLWKMPRGVNRPILLPFQFMFKSPEPKQEKKDLDDSSSQFSSSDSVTTISTTPAACTSNPGPEPEPGVAAFTPPLADALGADSQTSPKSVHTGPAEPSRLSLLYAFQHKAYGMLCYFGGMNPLLPSATQVPLLWSGYFTDAHINSEGGNILGIVSVHTGVVTGILFGAIHFSAWNAIFPSATEQALWKMCCVAIVVLPAAFGCLNWTDQGIIWLKLEKRSGWWTLLSCTILAGEAMLLAFYLVCRAVMLVLPLMQLRALPDGALMDLGWSRFIPHIG
jgi:hypothetical protein